MRVARGRSDTATCWHKACLTQAFFIRVVGADLRRGNDPSLATLAARQAPPFKECTSIASSKSMPRQAKGYQDVSMAHRVAGR
ncbi:hypothetical protein CA260_13630 [Dyella jiangningensis]|uniref:Uncharacterized protein n=1 Tax=Dyella jiangningensis TaxID=1379159 RepID=A0A328P381_9GAMM|nr:hypothetical protein CA260_13630 [Dyella jiangningensis]